MFQTNYSYREKLLNSFFYLVKLLLFHFYTAVKQNDDVQPRTANGGTLEISEGPVT